MKNAYFISHNGLGDNITNIGAVNFLLQYYDTIYFLCKDIYQSNVIKLFETKSVVTIPFDSQNEFLHCKTILSNADTNDDLFVSGGHKGLSSSRITHSELLKYKKNVNPIPVKYNHIHMFYDDIGLDTDIYVNYFDIQSTEQSLQRYHAIQHYNIIFLHTQASNRKIQLTSIIDKYKDQEDYIIICADENVYLKEDSKYSIANQYINLLIYEYIDVIKNATSIHIVDSCFACIVYPLLLSNSKRLHSEDVHIYDR